MNNEIPNADLDRVLAPHYRGYAVLGTGQYVLNTTDIPEPAELVISIATDEEKAGRAVGDDKDNPPDHSIQPEQMCIRIRFVSLAGLEALEKRLRILRAEHFGEPPHV